MAGSSTHKDSGESPPASHISTDSALLMAGHGWLGAHEGEEDQEVGRGALPQPIIERGSSECKRQVRASQRYRKFFESYCIKYNMARRFCPTGGIRVRGHS